jgi:aryl-alcohol dehydrogenase-like predicted oxidoreductase
VALNWLIQQGDVLPIPGAKTEAQAIGNAGALGWALRPAEVAALGSAFRP